MKILNLLCLVILVFIACGDEETQELNKNEAEEELNLPPITASSSTGEIVEPEQGWECGSEQIVVEGPNGEMIIKQISLECDPIADVYLGCPAPSLH